MPEIADTARVMRNGNDQQPNSSAQETGDGDPWLLANDLELALHMRDRPGVRMRGRHIFYDGRLSLPEQRQLLLQCIDTFRKRRPPLKPLRKRSGDAPPNKRKRPRAA